MLSAPSLSDASIQIGTGKIDGDIDSKFMMLKLKRAGLESQVSFSRTQLMIAEMQLQMVDKELDQMSRIKSAPEAPPARPLRRRPYKFVKLIRKVIKPPPLTSNTNTGGTTPDSTNELSQEATHDFGKNHVGQDKVKESGQAEKRKSELADHRSKKMQRSNEAQNKARKDSDRVDTQKDKHGDTRVDTKCTKHKTEKTNKISDKKKKTDKKEAQTEEIKNKTAKDKKSDSSKTKHRNNESKSKSSKTTECDKNKKKKSSGILQVANSKNHKGLETEQNIENEGIEKDPASNVEKSIKSVSKNSSITKEINNNGICEDPEPQKTSDFEVNTNNKTTCNITISDDDDDYIERTSETLARVCRSDIIIKIPDCVVQKIKDMCDDIPEGCEEVKEVVNKRIDAVLDSTHNDLLFKELRDSPRKEKSASISSLETLVL